MQIKQMPLHVKLAIPVPSQVKRPRPNVRCAARASTTTRQHQAHAASALRANSLRAKGWCSAHSVLQGVGFTRRASTTLPPSAATAREGRKQRSGSHALSALPELTRLWRAWPRACSVLEENIRPMACLTAWSVRRTRLLIKRGRKDGSVVNVRTGNFQKQELRHALKNRHRNGSSCKSVANIPALSSLERPASSLVVTDLRGLVGSRAQSLACPPCQLIAQAPNGISSLDRVNRLRGMDATQNVRVHVLST
eukprot:768646-Hanusia_phi.AAC.4